MKSSNLPKKPAGALRLLFVSDVHLGHRKTKSRWIVNRLDKYITNTAVMLSTDAIVIPGDLFDRLLNLPTDGVSEIRRWVNRLLNLAIATNTAIRILEGTPSHDWKQSQMIHDLNVSRTKQADVQYITDLSIVKDETLGITIGYVPDEWRETHEQTTKEFSELMATRGYSQVDLIVMHGNFEWQIPVVKIPSFMTHEWEKWVKHRIVIGHDHRHKGRGKIIVPGSFDRLTQGEEDPKGFVLLDILNNEVTEHFIVNEDATKFITLDVSGHSEADMETYVKPTLESIKSEYSELKLRVADRDLVKSQVESWREQYPNVQISVEAIKNKDKELIENTNFSLKEDVINITPDNINDMIIRELGHQEMKPGDMFMKDLPLLPEFERGVTSEIDIILGSM